MKGGERSGEAKEGFLLPDSVAEIRYELSLVRSHLNHYAQDDLVMSRHDLFKTVARLNKVMEILHGSSE